MKPTPLHISVILIRYYILIVPVAVFITIHFIGSVALLFYVTMMKTGARCYQSIKNYFGSTVNQRVMDKNLWEIAFVS